MDAAEKLNLRGEGERVTLFLAHRRLDKTADRARIPTYLASPIEDIRFLTAKWIAAMAVEHTVHLRARGDAFEDFADGE